LKAASLTVLFGEVTVAGVTAGIAAGCFSVMFEILSIASSRDFQMRRCSRKDHLPSK